jgi:hypothetical protein
MTCGLRRAAVSTVIAAISPILAFAQPGPIAYAGSGAVLPTGQGIASLRIANGRKVPIDRQAAQDPQSSQFGYFYEPLFILKENGTPISGYPAVVLKTTIQNGLTYLRFGLTLSAPEATAAARQVIASADPIYVSASQRPSIAMNPWPVEYMSAAIKSNSGNDASLGSTWQSGPISNYTGDLEFEIGFDDADLARFKADAANGYINYEYGYSYTNTDVAFATISASFKSRALGAINTALNSLNNASGRLFQHDYSTLSETLNTEYTSYIFASDSALIPYLQTTVLQQLYKPSEVQWNTPDPAMQQALAAYVKPLLHTYATKNTQDHSVTHDVTKDLKLNVGIGGSSISPEMKDELQTKDGVTLEEDQSTQTYLPRTITVYQRNNMSVADVVNTAQDVYISKGPSATRILDEVPMSVSQSNVNFGGPPTQSQFVGIAPGVAVCFLSDGALPDGYTELNGTSRWPNSGWVPAAARGQLLPDVRNVLAGGGDSNNVGQVTGPGTVSISGTLPAVITSSSLYGIAGTYGVSSGPPPNQLQLSPGFSGPPFAVPASGVNLSPEQQVSSVGGSLSGPVTIAAAPPFLHCRWIVRATP